MARSASPAPRPPSDRRWWRALAALLPLALAACASLPTDYPRTVSTALTDTADTALGRTAARFSAEQQAPSGLRLLDRGLDAFVARLALAEVAERSLDVQYYIWHDDTTGRLLTAALLRAADRGVRVRVILDDIGTSPDDARLLLLDAHANIELRLFNPVATRSARMLGFIVDPARSNRRMHNKSFTADNQATIVGGRNIGDEYFEARADLDFGDLDVLAVGEVVADVSASFDEYWNSAATFPIRALSRAEVGASELDAVRSALTAFVGSQRGAAYAQALRASDLTQQLLAGRLAFNAAQMRVLADDPAKVEQDEADKSAYLLPQMLPEFTALSREFFLVSPYFVPGDGGVESLKRLRARGVRVQILTNSLAATDVPAVHAGYAKYRRALLEAGVELYEVKASARRADPKAAESGPAEASAKHSLTGSSRASLHAKTMIFDCRQLFVGSMNVDPRSVFTNTEIGIMIDSPAVAAAACAQLAQGLPSNAYRVELQPQPDGRPHLAWVSTDAGREVRLAEEPGGSAWRSFQAWFFSLLPIEPLL
ncbi:MAG: phospholipase D family protein [Burkholderiaceae bacterium]|nr:phospholipase D family protein [Burkholderiaceae bacterium]